MLIGRWEMVGEVSEGLSTNRLPCSGKRGDRKLLVGTTELVDDDDMDFLEMLYQGVQIIYLETAAGVVATLGRETSERERGV